MTVGDGTAVTVSGATRLPRLTVNTWSRESMQVPATSPVTQGLGLPVAELITSGVPKSPALGSGSFGQVVSARNCGTWGEPRVFAWVCPVMNARATAEARSAEPA